MYWFNNCVFFFFVRVHDFEQKIRSDFSSSNVFRNKFDIVEAFLRWFFEVFLTFLKKWENSTKIRVKQESFKKITLKLVLEKIKNIENSLKNLYERLFKKAKVLKFNILKKFVKTWRTEKHIALGIFIQFLVQRIKKIA